MMKAAAAVSQWVRAHVALCAVLACVLAFYLWTAATSSSPFDFGKDQADYYNLLADGFLHGHLSLDVKPPPELLALPDPYDPVANAAHRGLHDASLYRGRYYLQWGPVPALLAFIPYRILPLGDLPQSLAAALFAFAGLCFASALLRFLVRCYLPDTPRWMVGVGVLALATGSAVPFLLRRVLVYEIALLSAYAFFMAALYLLASGALPRPARPRRLAAGSLCLGLAVGCRPTMVLPAVLLVGLWWSLTRRDGSQPRRLAAVVLGPALAVGVLLALYNAVRFGSPLEFGTSYQLAGVDVRTLRPYQLAYVAPGLWYYLLTPADLTVGFPFFLPSPLAYPRSLPGGYQLEIVAGVLPNVPITLAALAALALRRPADRPPRWIVLGLFGLGIALVAFISFSLFGATMRYESDFATLFVLAGVLGWLTLAHRTGGATVRRTAAVLGTVLVAWGVCYGVAMSFTGYGDALRNAQPETYRALEDATSPLPTAVAKLKGHPLLVDVNAPDGANPLQVGARTATITIVSNRDQRYLMTADIGTFAHGDRGAVLSIVMSRTHRATSVRAVGRAEVISLALARGLNRIELSTTGPFVRLQNVTLAARLADAR